jgi:uncharacterized protein YjgD (DUF1641 family)
MARPIGLELAPRDPREELRKRLEQAPGQHAEALLESYELLQLLHDSGVLRLLRGALGSGDMLLETAVNAAKSEESIRGLRNAIALAKMLGAINPDLLQGYANAVSETFSREKPVVEPPGLFTLLAEFRRPELRRGLALISKLLEILGSEDRSKPENSAADRSTL